MPERVGLKLRLANSSHSLRSITSLDVELIPGDDISVLRDAHSSQHSRKRRMQDIARPREHEVAVIVLPEPVL
ncbi:MAG TPA: hypothetical protein VNN10_10480 [Dehalococcoidia bacterium]|nr:hypothetical protein [Dehalococcoidia bacterium]